MRRESDTINIIVQTERLRLNYDTDSTDRDDYGNNKKDVHRGKLLAFFGYGESDAKAEEKEESVLGKQILAQLQDNLEIAASDMIPICQDTGMAVVFLEVGQDVHFEGGSLEDAVNEGVRRGYTEGF